MRALCLVVVLLSGCFSEPEKPNAGVRKERQAKAAAAIAKTPTPRTYRYTDGELRVLDVPSADKNGFMEAQRCFLWRDTEWKTSSLSCSGQADLFPSFENPGPKD